MKMEEKGGKKINNSPVSVLINLLRKGDQRLSRWLEFQVSPWLVCRLLPTLLAALDIAWGFFVLFFFVRVFCQDERKEPVAASTPFASYLPSASVSSCVGLSHRVTRSQAPSKTRGFSFPRSHLLPLRKRSTTDPNVYVLI